MPNKAADTDTANYAVQVTAVTVWHNQNDSVRSNRK